MSGPARGDPSPDAERPERHPAGPDDRSPPDRPARGPRRRPADSPRFPAWLAIPVAAFGGWWAADWPGALFGAVAGFFLWRARR